MLVVHTSRITRGLLYSAESAPKASLHPQNLLRFSPMKFLPGVVFVSVFARVSLPFVSDWRPYLPRQCFQQRSAPTNQTLFQPNYTFCQTYKEGVAKLSHCRSASCRQCDLGAVPLGVYGLLVSAINTETTPPVQGDSFRPSEIVLIAEQN